MNEKAKQNQFFIIDITPVYHNSVSDILCNGYVITAPQGEQFTEKKNDKSFWSKSIRYCLNKRKIEPGQLSEIIFYEQPKLKLDRLSKTYLKFAPRGVLTFSKVVFEYFGEKRNKRKLITNALNSTGKKYEGIYEKD